MPDLDLKVGSMQRELQLREDTRLAVDGKARCRRCQKVASQEEMVVVVMMGNVIFASCPMHVRRVVMRETETGLQITYDEPTAKIVLAHSFSGALSRPNPQGLKQPAKPKVTRTPIFVTED